MDWDLEQLEAFIQRRGEEVVHETAIACPSCRNEDIFSYSVEVDGRPANIRSLSCPQCYGDGFIYRNPQIIKGLVSAIDPGNRVLTDIGYSVPGDCVFSPSMAVAPLGDFDRVTFQVPSSVGGQVILRGAATMQQNASLTTDLSPQEDRLWYLPECALWCEDQNGVIYTQGADYTFDDKKIVWVDGRGPSMGTLYSLKYRAYLEWVTYSSPMERYDRGRNLAQRVLLRKKHVHFQGGNLADSPGDRLEQQEAFTTKVKI